MPNNALELEKEQGYRKKLTEVRKNFDPNLVNEFVTKPLEKENMRVKAAVLEHIIKTKELPATETVRKIKEQIALMGSKRMLQGGRNLTPQKKGEIASLFRVRTGKPTATDLIRLNRRRNMRL